MLPNKARGVPISLERQYVVAQGIMFDGGYRGFGLESTAKRLTNQTIPLRSY